MTFTESIKSCLLTNFANFSGRASRSEYWYFYLFTFIVSFVFYLFKAIAEAAGSNGGTMAVGAIVALAAGLVLLWSIIPSLAVGVRRLRDAGYGWYNIFWPLLPFAGAIVLLVLLCKESKGETPSPKGDFEEQV